MGLAVEIGLGVVSVYLGDVVENVFMLDQHLAHTVVDYDRQFTHKCLVVGPGPAVGDRG